MEYAHIEYIKQLGEGNMDYVIYIAILVIAGLVGTSIRAVFSRKVYHHPKNVLGVNEQWQKRQSKEEDESPFLCESLKKRSQKYRRIRFR